MSESDLGISRLYARHKVTWVQAAGLSVIGLFVFLVPFAVGPAFAGLSVAALCWLWLGIYSGWWIGLNHLHDFMHLEMREKLKGKTLYDLIP